MATAATKVALLYDGKYWIEPLVKSIKWSGDSSLPYRTLTLDLANTRNGSDQAVRFELGKEIRFYVDDVGLFRGVIFSYSVNQSGAASIIAYDENVYLTKNSDTRKFTNMTAGAIVKDVCTTFGIPTGTIADTGYVIPRMILRETDLWSMIVTALRETQKQSGRKFRVFASNGKLNLAEKKESVVRWMLEDGVNILTAERARSIDDLRTSVKIIGGDDEDNPITATEKDATLAAKYGTMQQVERADSTLNKSQIAQLAKQRLKDLGKVGEEVTVEALGNAEVIAGAAVYAFESMTEIAGGYYVTADTHTFEGGVHRMEVTLSRTDDLPDMGYAAAFDDIKEKKKKAKDKEASPIDQLIAQLGG